MGANLQKGVVSQGVKIKKNTVDHYPKLDS
jgi:hypothetical protein